MFSDADALEELPLVPGALFNHRDEAEDPVCHEDTRTAVLQEIYDWAERNDEKPVFWLTGWAGTGKSTIARTVARRYHQREKLGASFFFSRDKGDCGSTTKFASSIAYQLATRSPSLKESIYNTLRRNKGILDGCLSDQWEQLVLSPISALDDPGYAKRYLLVIDALDECEAKCETLVRLLFETQLTKIRLFVTSRPDLPVPPERLKSQYRSLILHKVSPESVDEDIFKFLHGSLARDRDDWLETALLRRLVEKAGGLFIWAATASRFLTDSPEVADSRLCELLSDEELNREPGMDLSDNESNAGPGKSLKPDQSLDLIYLAVLRAAVSPKLSHKEKGICLNLMRRYLGSIVILSSQLSPHALYTLVEMDTKKYKGIHAHEILRKLRAILDIPKNKDEECAVIRPHHPSLCDFLLNATRCNDEQFYVCRKQAHQIVFDGCLQLLSQSLRQDICDLEASDASVEVVPKSRIEQALPPAVQYACLYWVKHLRASECVNRDLDSVHEMLNNHVLHWLEALSWMRKYHDGLDALASLNTFLLVCLLHESTMNLTSLKHRERPQLSNLVKDIIRFTRCHGPVIEQTPLQLYLGSIVFSPQESLVRQRYGHIGRQYLEYLPRTRARWGMHLHSLEYHRESVERLAFSDERQMLASASTDGTLRLWDVTTGRCLRVIEGFKGKITAISFSPEGKWLASLSGGMIHVWDVATGLCIQGFEESQGFKAMAFAGDGKLVAVSHTQQVQYRDVASKECVRSIHGLVGHPASVIFSEDAKTIATWSFNGLVRVWNLTTDRCIIKVILDSTVGSDTVALSPDGKILAAAASTEIQAFDTETGDCLTTLQGHLLRINALAVAAGNQTLASVSNDTTVKLWSLATGQCLHTLKGHRHPILAVTLSQGRKMVASGSMDCTARLWDMSAVHDLHMTEETTDTTTVTALALDDHAMLAALGYADSSIQLYYPYNGRKFMTLSGHSDRIADLAFLADGGVLASASVDCTLRLWNTELGHCLHVLKGHTSSISRIVTTHNRLILASLSVDRNIRLWNAESEACLHTLTGHTGYVEGAAFSKDDTILATSSSDQTIRLWNVEDGICFQILKGHQDRVMGLDFSDDQKILASASFDRTVRLWDVDCGCCLQEYSHVHKVTSVAISGNKSMLASISGLGTLRVWDIRSGECVQVLNGRLFRVIHLSSSGRYLETEHGSLMLEAKTTVPEDASEQPASAIYVDRSWVIYGGQKMLCLPREYHNPKHVAVRGTTAVLAYNSGQVLILRFK
ncbi:uncharacterized protein CDV56_102161 [Aspergillus thermomutatus]|uniref:Mitochondrial division protein 1 n=1 Tax=Aspergillus thermomutatus TaxID=41047 RepID=A0A397HD39_ASPTH|nr:uncharacterized protein CDV56_102161 [Aspergillus thermomutatus]RHZ59243.1 hypothetical protein CDV56_102161 [Aspergillus thermomutatus]